MGVTNFNNGIMATPNIGGDLNTYFASGNVQFVDGDLGVDGGTYGDSPSRPVKTIGQAVLNINAGGTIYVKARKTVVGATDPVPYAETVIIPNSKPNVTIIGIPNSRVQGALPEIKPATTTAALITVRAMGFSIFNMVINGLNGTGGGILLDDDGSTKVANGFTAMNCHFKNCVGTTATNAATGGAISWSTNGGAWQALIKGNKFYKNVGDIVLIGTAQTVPQDVVIEDNVFSGPASVVDCNLYLAGGSGMNGVVIRNNEFPCFPALGGGTNHTQLVLTGCVGILANNRFATSGKTFGAGGNNLVPTTVFMAGNFQEISAGANATGEIGRT